MADNKSSIQDTQILSKDTKSSGLIAYISWRKIPWYIQDHGHYLS